MADDATVFVVDDDESVRESIAFLLSSVGLKVEGYETAQRFLDSCDQDRPGCLVLDVRMPGMSGVELQKRLNHAGMSIPTIIITGHGDVQSSVAVMKAGAVDLLEKPFHDQELIDKVQECLELDLECRKKGRALKEARERMALLTPREREVLDLVVAGKANKVIAAELGLSDKTVEAHRGHAMHKMQVGSLAELVALFVRLRQTDSHA